MKKYRKVTEMDVLKKCCEIELEIDYSPISFVAQELNTSKYRVQKAYKSLLQQGYMKLDKVCTYADEYWNGLYDETVPILFTKVYMTTYEGRKLFEKEINQRIDELLKGERNNERNKSW